MAVLSTDDGDTELIAAAQRGERSALDAFVRRHDRWVRYVVYAACGDVANVDDVAQRVWANVWQQIGTLVAPEKWRGWLYRMARNAAIDVGLKASRDRQLRISYGREVSKTTEGPADRLTQNEERRRMLAAVKGLPAIYREPFVLRHLEDWSYAQIGEALGLPVDTVETRLVRARRLLRDALAEKTPRRNR
jgi:RNA polymerase sigma-70 factor (ECF subfamily)